MTRRHSGGGSMHTWGRMAGSLATLARTRMELFGIELAEEKDRLLSLLLLSLFSVVIGLLALISLTALIVLALWDPFQWHTLAVLTLVYVAITIYCGWRLMSKVSGAPPAFETTRAEFENDHIMFEKWRQSRDESPPDAT